MTTVSVIIPTWNRATSLECAVRSALTQTHPPLEVLVCDDGSTDNTEQVVRSIGDSRVVWCPGERAGRPAIPRNRGIRASRGEWLAFLDDDDVWLPEKLAIQLERLQVSGCFASCSDAFRIMPDRGNQGCLLGLEINTLLFEDILDVNRVICSSVLVSAVVVKIAGGFPESPSLLAIEDYALWLRLLSMTNFEFVALPLLEYCDDPHQSIRKGGRFTLQQQALLDDYCAWAQRQGGGYLDRASELKRRRRDWKSPLRTLVDCAKSAFGKS